jgi:chorismate mutase
MFMGMSLENVRAEITRIDAGIIRLIAERQELATEIVKIKKTKGMPIHDEQRASNVLDSVAGLAAEKGIDPVAVRKIFEILIHMSEEHQRGYSVMDKPR